MLSSLSMTAKQKKLREAIADHRNALDEMSQQFNAMDKAAQDTEILRKGKKYEDYRKKKR